MKLLYYFNKISHNAILQSIIIIILAFFSYSNIFINEFVYDDIEFIVEWSEAESLTITDAFRGVTPEGFEHRYRPIKNLALSAVYKLGGGNPTAFHIFSLLLIICTSLLVWKLNTKIAGSKAGFVTGLIYAVMPIHTESVTFMTASYDYLAMPFLLSSVFCYMLYKEKKHTTLLVASIIFSGLAYFTFEITIILPVLLITYDSLIRKEKWNQIKSQLLTSYGGHTFFIIVYLIVNQAIAAHTVRNDSITTIDLFIRLLTATKVFVLYVYLTIVNFPLNANHTITIERSLSAHVFASLLFILAFISMTVWAIWKKYNLFAFGLVWFLVAIAPVSNIVQLVAFAGERYLFLASMGWALLIGLIIKSIIVDKKKFQNTAILSLLTLIAIYGTLTYTRNKDWQNEEKLWAATLQYNPNDIKALNNIAFYYSRNGNKEKARQIWNRIFELDPKYTGSYIGLAKIEMDSKNYREAIKYLKKSLEVKNNNIQILNTLALAYIQLGEYGKANNYLTKAINIEPRYLNSVFNLAVIKVQLEQWDQALTYFHQANTLKPNNPEILFGIGLSYYHLGSKEQALEYINMALTIKSDYQSAKEFLQSIK